MKKMQLLNFVNPTGTMDIWQQLIALVSRDLSSEQVHQELLLQGYYVPVDMCRVVAEGFNIDMDLHIGLRQNEVPEQ